MNVPGVIHLAWRYVAFHRLTTGLLISCVTLTIYLPVAARLVVDRFQTELQRRAESTPLVIGTRGSRFELAIHALHFEGAPPGVVAVSECDALESSGLAQAIPVHARFEARGFPIVGTTLDYFDWRRLKVRRGTRFVRLGDCVLGSDVAKQLDLDVGDRLLSDPENAYNPVGRKPLEMHVAGILERTDSDDDRAVFVDLTTAWVVEGLGHGHEDVSQIDDEGLLMGRDGETIVASPAVTRYIEITDANRDSFHFHGDRDTFPITAIIALPPDEKSRTLLEGRYRAAGQPLQALRPSEVMDELVERVFRAKRFFDAALVVVAVVTGLFLVLVSLLSQRLRKREMLTLYKIGCSRYTIFWMQVSELAMVFVASIAISGVLAAATLGIAPQLIRQLVF